MSAEYTVTFEAQIKIVLSDAPDDAEYTLTRQALQNDLGHTGIVIGEVISVD